MNWIFKTRSNLIVITFCIFSSICIVLMIFGNYGGGKYWFFLHARWNGKSQFSQCFGIMPLKFTFSLLKTNWFSTTERIWFWNKTVVNIKRNLYSLYTPFTIDGIEISCGVSNGLLHLHSKTPIPSVTYAAQWLYTRWLDSDGVVTVVNYRQQVTVLPAVANYTVTVQSPCSHCVA